MNRLENAADASSSKPKQRVYRSLTMFGVGLFCALAPGIAHAHFKLDSPASWMSQSSLGAPQKNGPCAATGNTHLGDPAGTPTQIVSAFQPGETVSVSVTATLAHPGWWRIALAEGPSRNQTLTSLPDPVPRAGTNCTPAILTNPVWSKTQPVLADGLPAGSTVSTVQSGTQTFHVTIPATASCPSAQPCTLQVIMVMTDHPAGDCYYHHCADVSVRQVSDAGVGSDGSAGASGAAGAAGSPDAASGGNGAAGAAGIAGSSSGAGGAGGAGTGGSAGQSGTTSSQGSNDSAGCNYSAHGATNAWASAMLLAGIAIGLLRRTSRRRTAW